MGSLEGAGDEERGEEVMEGMVDDDNAETGDEVIAGERTDRLLVV